MAGMGAGYGAGGAAAITVEKLIEQRLMRDKFAEMQRAQRAEEAQRAADMQMRRDQLVWQQEQTRADRELRTRERGEDLAEKQRVEGIRQSEWDADQERGAFERDQSRKEKDEDRRQRREEAEANRKTQERIAGMYSASRQGAASNKTVKVTYTDPQTGEVFEEYLTPQEARERGPMRKADPSIAKAMRPIQDYLTQIDDAMAYGQDNGWANTGPLESRVRSIVPGGGGFSKAGESIRNKLGNLFSSLSHERFGGALTPQEIERAQNFLPEPSDSPQRIESKLTNLRKFMSDKLAKFGPPAIPGDDGPSSSDGKRPRLKVDKQGNIIEER